MISVRWIAAAALVLSGLSAAAAAAAAQPSPIPFVRTDIVNPIPVADQKVMFAFGSADLSDEAKAALDRQAVVMHRYSKANWRIRATATEDETTSAVDADSLSFRRAQAVAAYLVSCGVSENALSLWPVGARSIIVRNTAPESLAKLRFAETEIFGQD